MTTQPKISIVTVCYNEVERIQKTIDSVLSQSYKNIEYIIIDGHSTDGSKELIEKQQAKVDCFVSETDNGIYEAMNKGLKKSNGEYVIYMNAGDHFYNNTSLESLVNGMHDVDLVYGTIFLDGKTPVSIKDTIDVNFLWRRIIFHQSYMIKRTLLEQIGGFREDFRIISDWVLLFELFLKFKPSYQFVDVKFSVFYRDGVSTNTTLAENERDEYKKSRFCSEFIEHMNEFSGKLFALNSLLYSKKFKMISRFLSKELIARLKG